MRHISTKLLAAAAVASMFVSCAKEMESPLQPADNTNGFIMRVRTNDLNTKTVITDTDSGNSYGINWETTDQLGVFEVANGVVQAKAVSAVLGGENPTSEASFTFSLPTPDPEGPYKYAFVNPSSALGITEIESENKYTVCLPQNQTFKANSFDPAADVLVSELKSSESRPTSVTAKFARVGATARMVIKCPTTSENIQSITFSTTEGNISGYYIFDPATGKLSNGIASGQGSVVLTPAVSTPFTGDVVVWFRLASITLSDNFRVSVRTDLNKVYTKEVNLATDKKTLAFTEGKLTKFNVSLEDKSASFNLASGYSNAEEYSELTVNSITFAPDKGSNSNAPKYFNTGSAGRFYGGNTITISCADTKTIKTVDFTFGSDDGSNAITADVGSYSDGSWTGAEKEIVFTIGGTTGNRRITKVDVTYVDYVMTDERYASTIVAGDMELFVGQTDEIDYDIEPLGASVTLSLGTGASGYVSVDGLNVTGIAATEGVPVVLSFAGNESYKPTSDNATIVVHSVPVILSFSQTNTGFTASINEMIGGFSYTWVLYHSSVAAENIVSNNNRTSNAVSFSGTFANDLSIDSFTAGDQYLLVVTATKSELSASSSSSSFTAADAPADGNEVTILAPPTGCTVSVSAGGSSVYSGNSVSAGTSISLDASSNVASHAFDSWIVYKTDDHNIIVPVNNSSFVMPAYAVTIKAVFTTTVTKTMNEIVNANNYTVSSGNTIGSIVTSFDLDDVITVSTSGSANCGTFWGTTTYDWRLYQAQNGDVTIGAGENTITSLTITYLVSNNGTLKSGSTTIASNSAQTPNASSVTYTVGNTSNKTNGQVRVTQISVTYK